MSEPKVDLTPTGPLLPPPKGGKPSSKLSNIISSIASLAKSLFSVFSHIFSWRSSPISPLKVNDSVNVVTTMFANPLYQGSKEVETFEDVGEPVVFENLPHAVVVAQKVEAVAATASTLPSKAFKAATSHFSGLFDFDSGLKAMLSEKYHGEEKLTFVSLCSDLKKTMNKFKEGREDAQDLEIVKRSINTLIQELKSPGLNISESTLNRLKQEILKKISPEECLKAMLSKLENDIIGSPFTKEQLESALSRIYSKWQNFLSLIINFDYKKEMSADTKTKLADTKIQLAVELHTWLQEMLDEIMSSTNKEQSNIIKDYKNICQMGLKQFLECFPSSATETSDSEESGV